MTRVAIVGGGVTGLTTAFRLTLLAPALEVVVFESEQAPGGKLRSVRLGELSIPSGADSFVARKPWAADLCRQLDLALESPDVSRVLLWTEGGLVPYPSEAAFGIPSDLGDVLRWPGLSRRGRLRALVDLVKRKRRGGGDEALGALLRRRLGHEAGDLAIAPLLAGLFAGRADSLSVQATFPELVAWEEQQGSLLRGAQATRRAAGADPGPMFVRPIGGVEVLPRSLAARLGPRVRTGTAVRGLERRGAGWAVRVADETIDADAVVISTQGYVAGELLAPHVPSVASALRAIPYVSTGVVLLVYPQGTRRGLPRAGGFVVPEERAPFTACSFLSNKWPESSFGERAVLRCYVGAAGSEDVIEAADHEIVDACAGYLPALVDLPPKPECSRVVRWRKSMPQFEVGHLQRVAAIRAGLPPGIFVVGQATDGVGVADCVRAANSTAEDVLTSISGKSSEREAFR